MVLAGLTRASLTLVAAVAALALWLRETSSGRTLAAQVAQARAVTRDAAELRRETDAFRRVQPSDTELQRLRTVAATVSPTIVSPPAPTRLPIGMWRPAAEWTNRGDATPHAAVETTLWAAAGGDVASLEGSIVLDAETRAKADALLSALPAATRASFPTVERLIAAFTVKSIPVGEAQVVWQREQEDAATVCIFLRNPQHADGSTTFRDGPPAATGPAERVPPMQRPEPRSGAVYLQLRRVDERWKLVVPESALKKISAELRGSR